MSKILTNLIYSLKKPKVIIVAGEGSGLLAEAIFQVLKQNFQVNPVRDLSLNGVKKEKQPFNWWEILKTREKILILESDLKKLAIQNFQGLIKYSSLPILVVTQVGEIPFAAYLGEPRPQSGRDHDFFAGEKERVVEIIKLAKVLPPFGYLVLNFDDETVREIKEEVNLREITFGFGEGADFRATDVKLNQGETDPLLEKEKLSCGTNFKINYKGNVVPVWLASTPNLGVGVGKEQIYAALSAACVGTIFDLNLVEISQALTSWRNFESTNS